MGILEFILSISVIIGGIIGVYVSIKVKIKEIEVRIGNIEQAFESFKQDRIEMLNLIEKHNDRLWLKLDAMDAKMDVRLNNIDVKMDAKFDLLTALKAEHDQIKCKYYDK